MKRILGLDVGTNSIGGALINLPEKLENYGATGNIEWVGSRIIPLDGDYLQKFEGGAQGETKAAFRRGKRGSRRLKHRYKLRRTRLIKVFKVLTRIDNQKWIDESFPLDESRKFKQNIKENGYSLKISEYLPFSEETISEFEKEMGIEGKKSKKRNSIVPEDWIVYYLRKKALSREITIPELARIIYMMNQRRGFKSSRKDLKSTNILPYDEFVKQTENNDFDENGIETQFVSITKIESVHFKEEKKDKKGNVSNVYTIKAEDPRMGTWEETRKKEPEWVGKEFIFLVVQKVDKTGKQSQNKPQMPKENDWALCTTALSEKIQERNQHPGEYFFEELKKAYTEDRNYKIRQYPVYRWRYQKELEAIWNKQCELNPDLNKLNSDKTVLTELATILYPAQVKNNMPKLSEFIGKDLLHIISNDIIYYQRELKSQKNSIGECRYEKRKGIDDELHGLKCIPRSSPVFQEFRIWQDIHNMRILEREVKIEGKTTLDKDVSSTYMDENVKACLFDLFNCKVSITEKDILNLIKEIKPENNIKLDIDKKENTHSHRINLFANRESLKGNEILSRYRSIFKKAGFNGEIILSDEKRLLKLWHIDYSITSSDEEKSKKGIETALSGNIKNRRGKEKKNVFDFPDTLIDMFCKLPELKKEYGSYSTCAIRKLLPVMRCGKYWRETEIDHNTKTRIEKITTAEFDINVDNETRKKIQKWERENRKLDTISDYYGLPVWLAGYVVYGIHSEKDKAPIKTVEEFSRYIQKEIPNNSLRNPIVEQIVKETTYLVRDIWTKYGQIDEIHIELGRNLKNNSAERDKISKSQAENFNEKQRIKKLLYELMNDGFEQYNDEIQIEHVNFEVKPNPESPIDIDKFRIWRSLSKQSEIDWAKKVKDEKIPTKQEIKKYALWLSQNCRSPYTGKIIPLSKLFDKTQYEIEHVIPRKKMKNDSFNNLVIAETAINPKPYKGDLLARNFIAQFGGKNGKEYEITGKKYFIFGEGEYETHCKETFKFQKAKLKNLLATEVPEDFVERQLNDTRYISRKLAELLAPVARNENGIIFTGGIITSELKSNWGLNKIWKEIILPRFERLEEITEKKGEYIICDKDDHGNPVIHLNVKENPKLDTKRIDHRHHALDALIIAATTREHIRYLNTLNAADTNDEIKQFKQSLVKGKIRDFKLPWEKFTEEVQNKLEELVVSFKTNNKIVSLPKNRTAYFKTENGTVKKKFKEQKANPRWMSVRKSMFKEPQGIIYLKEVYEERNIAKAIEIQINRMSVKNKPEMRIAPYVYDQEARKIIKDLIERTGISIQEKNELLNEIKKHLKKNPLKDLSGEEYQKIKIATFEEYAAKRVPLDKTFDHKKIDKIPYAKIGKSVLGNLLHEHLDSDEFKDEKGYPDKAKAFDNEGLEILAKKAGRPITKVTIYEKKDESSKFGKQYVETDSGSNVYFVIYQNQHTKEREVLGSISTHKAIEKMVNGNPIADDKSGYDKIILSPGDLVYVPTNEQIKDKKEINWESKKEISRRVYQVRKFSKKQCYFLLSRISDLIIPYDANSQIGEYGSQNLSEKSTDNIKIIDVCIKLKVDRLGNIALANNTPHPKSTAYIKHGICRETKQPAV